MVIWKAYPFILYTYLTNQVTTLTDYGEVYLVNSRSEIKNIPTTFCMEFLADLKNEDGTFNILPKRGIL